MVAAGIAAPTSTYADELPTIGTPPISMVAAPARSEPGFGESSLFDPTRFELRGGFSVNPGGPEKNSYALNAELITPKLFSIDWLPSFFVPRFRIGGSISLSSKTSFGYAGALWTINLTERLFVEQIFGGAVHDGELVTMDWTGRASLGCRALYHLGNNFGYRLNSDWSIMFTYDHISNGRGTFSSCPRNYGLNELSLRLGRRF